MTFASTVSLSAPPLPSWQEGPARQAIVTFVERINRRASADFVAPADRIATFDNDGTLWPEQPIYVQAQFVIDRIRALAPHHPDWKERQPFKGALEGDFKAVAAGGERGIAELVMATHAGMTTDEFERIVTDWIGSAQHPRFKRPYTDLAYRPMLELIDYLRANAFKVYIVSGGGVEFMRPWAPRVYGVVPEQVIGSSIKVKFEIREGRPVLVRLPDIDLLDDKVGKPVGIHKYIGHRPVMAFGNSDGDLQMLQWTTSAPGARFAAIVHHTDETREWAYDRVSTVGRLDAALVEAKAKGWTVVSMRDDWKRIYAFEK